MPTLALKGSDEQETAEVGPSRQAVARGTVGQRIHRLLPLRTADLKRKEINFRPAPDFATSTFVELDVMLMCALFTM